MNEIKTRTLRLERKFFFFFFLFGLWLQPSAGWQYPNNNNKVIAIFPSEKLIGTRCFKHEVTLQNIRSQMSGNLALGRGWPSPRRNTSAWYMCYIKTCSGRTRRNGQKGVWFTGWWPTVGSFSCPRLPYLHPLTLDVWSGEHLGWAPHTETATELPQI